MCSPSASQDMPGEITVQTHRATPTRSSSTPPSLHMTHPLRYPGRTIGSTAGSSGQNTGCYSFNTKETAGPAPLLLPMANFSALIQGQEALGIVPVFWKDEEKNEGPAVL